MARSGFDVVAAISKEQELLPIATLACSWVRAQGGTVTLLYITPEGEKPDWLHVPERCSDVRVQTLVRAGADAAKVILEIVEDLRPDLLLMGWPGPERQRRYVLGSTLDPVARYAPCDVAVVHGQAPDPIRRVLVPVSSGPNAPLALELALDISRDVQVTALNVALTSLGPAAKAAGYEQLRDVLETRRDDERISAKVVQAPGIMEGILQEAREGYDLLLIGGSKENFIGRTLFGNLPQAVLAAAPVPTAVVQRRAGPVRALVREARQRLSSAEGPLAVAEQVETYREVRRGARSHPEFYVLMALAAAIAAVGLLMDSAAVVIGAMVIAPLMPAILGISLGMVQGDARLIWRASSTAARGIGTAILVGAVIGLVAPGKELTREIMARTQPTLFDLAVAIFSGLAGAYAQCRRSVLSIAPGVAISVALVPPLATVGIGIVMLDWRVATGALLLFLANLSAIIATGGIVFLFFGFGPGRSRRIRVFEGSIIGMLGLLVIVSILLTVLTVSSIQSAVFERRVQNVLRSEIVAMEGVALESLDRIDRDGETLDLLVQVQATREVSRQEVVALQERLSAVLEQPVALELVVVLVTELRPTPEAPVESLPDQRGSRLDPTNPMVRTRIPCTGLV